GVFGKPVMIGRALNGEVECDFKLVLTCRVNQRAKIFLAAQLRMNRFVTAIRTTDGIGAAGIICSSVKGVVAALAIANTNRMNGWKIKYVESHCTNGRQALDNIFKRAVTVRIITGRARK